MQIITYVSAHWVEIGAATALIVNGARIIVKLTPTTRDDSILEKIAAGLKHIGLVVKDK